MLVVARIWRLSDGTECWIGKTASDWCAFVTRAGVELQSESFSEGRAALIAARVWRSQFARRRRTNAA